MRLFIFGLGYSCLHFVAAHGNAFSAISGTIRSEERRDALAHLPAELLLFAGAHPDPAIAARLAEADVILASVPPGMTGDPALAQFGSVIAAGRARIVYLSTVGVYADHAGAWIDETATIVTDETRRGIRARAEAAWQTACPDRVSILRLAGIYGPGRNAFVNLANGRAHRIVKQDQVFNRIHVDDIVQAIAAAIEHPHAGTWNVCDDEPAPPQDVIVEAARLASLPLPPEIAYDDAALSPMAASFWGETKRVSNRLIREELDLRLACPTYREGLRAILRETPLRPARPE